MDAKDLIDRLEASLLSLDRVGTLSLLKDLARNSDPVRLIETVAVPALERIGRGWERGEAALAQVYLSGVLMEKFIDSIMLPVDPGRIHMPKMAIAVLEDHHFLGKRIVYSSLRASGYELDDYGRVTVDSLVERIKTDGPKILLLSVLMLPSALRVKNLKIRLKEAGLNPRVIVGGAPFRLDENLWREVGADGVGRSSDDALRLVRDAVEEVS